MLPKAFRLTHERDFSLVYKHSKPISSSHLKLYSLPQNQNQSRFGFVVSKKQVKTIVERNRIKRRLRAVISQKLSKLKSGYSVIIQVKNNARTMTTSELKAELEQLFHRSKLL